MHFFKLHNLLSFFLKVFMDRRDCKFFFEKSMFLMLSIFVSQITNSASALYYLFDFDPVLYSNNFNFAR